MIYSVIFISSMGYLTRYRKSTPLCMYACVRVCVRVCQPGDNENGRNLPLKVWEIDTRGERQRGQSEKGHKQSCWKGLTNQMTQEVNRLWDRCAEKNTNRKDRVVGPEINRHIDTLRIFFFFFLVKGFCWKGSHFSSSKTFIQPFVFLPCFLWNHPGYTFQFNLLRKPT